MYDWIAESFNPIGGVCPHKCRYCFAQNFRFPSLKEKYSGSPRLYEKELKRNLGKDKFWFVGSCIDIFAELIPSNWIHETLKHCKKFDNRYLFQSKNPGRIYELRAFLPPDVVVGTTVETNRSYPEMGDAPGVKDRAWAIFQLGIYGYETCITIEPIMDFDIDMLAGMIKAARPKFVNIGSSTTISKVPLPEPPSGKIKELITELKKCTEVKIKSNLKRLTS